MSSHCGENTAMTSKTKSQKGANKREQNYTTDTKRVQAQKGIDVKKSATLQKKCGDATVMLTQMMRDRK